MWMHVAVSVVAVTASGIDEVYSRSCKRGSASEDAKCKQCLPSTVERIVHYAPYKYSKNVGFSCHPLGPPRPRITGFASSPPNLRGNGTSLTSPKSLSASEYEIAVQPPLAGGGGRSVLSPSPNSDPPSDDAYIDDVFDGIRSSGLMSRLATSSVTFTMSCAVTVAMDVSPRPASSSVSSEYPTSVPASESVSASVELSVSRSELDGADRSDMSVTSGVISECPTGGAFAWARDGRMMWVNRTGWSSAVK